MKIKSIVNQKGGVMKKTTFYSFLVICLLSLASCLVEASWLDLVGRWQDVEAQDLEIEFTEAGKFIEYMYGEVIGYGDFIADGHNITLNYSSPCGGKNQVSCNIRLRFDVDDGKNTMTLEDSGGKLLYKRVDSE